MMFAGLAQFFSRMVPQEALLRVLWPKERRLDDRHGRSVTTYVESSKQQRVG